MSTNPERVMLLIDADNVSIDVMEQAVHLVHKQHGGLHVRRAYCTAESAVKHQTAFKRLGIKPMVNLAAGKNSTDIALAVDAIDLVLAERPDVVVIASSDSDFAPLVQRLREKGCVVRGIGQAGKTGDETLEVYDDYTVLEHRRPAGSVGDDAAPARKAGARKAAAPKTPARKSAAVGKAAAGKKAGPTRAAGKAAPTTPPPAAPAAVAAAGGPGATAAATAAPSAAATVSQPASPVEDSAPGALAAPPPTPTPAEAPAARKAAAKKGGAAAKTARKTTARKSARAAAPADAEAAVAVAAEAAPPSHGDVARPADAAGVEDLAEPSPPSPASGPRLPRSKPSETPQPALPLSPPAPSGPQRHRHPADGGATHARVSPAAFFDCLPELAAGQPVALNVAVQRLREARLLGRNASSSKLFAQLAEHVELLPPDKPTQVRRRA